MPLTDADVRQMFYMDGKTVMWREVPVSGLTALFRRAAVKHNNKAGTAVEFWAGFREQPVVVAAGIMVTEKRIAEVLASEPGAPEVSTAKAAKPPKAKAAPAAKVSDAAPSPAPAAHPPADGMTDGERRHAEAYAKQARTRAIKTEMGFAVTPMGEWRHKDGRVWLDLFFQTEEGLAAAEKIDGKGGAE